MYSGENGGNGGFAVEEGREANGANGQDGGYAIGEGSEANGGGVATFGGKTGSDCSIAVGDSCFNQPEGIFNPF